MFERVVDLCHAFRHVRGNDKHRVSLGKIGLIQRIMREVVPVGGSICQQHVGIEQ